MFARFRRSQSGLPTDIIRQLPPARRAMKPARLGPISSTSTSLVVCIVMTKATSTLLAMAMMAAERVRALRGKRAIQMNRLARRVQRRLSLTQIAQSERQVVLRCGIPRQQVIIGGDAISQSRCDLAGDLSRALAQCQGPLRQCVGNLDQRGRISGQPCDTLQPCHAATRGLAAAKSCAVRITVATSAAGSRPNAWDRRCAPRLERRALPRSAAGRPPIMSSAPAAPAAPPAPVPPGVGDPHRRWPGDW